MHTSEWWRYHKFKEKIHSNFEGYVLLMEQGLLHSGIFRFGLVSLFNGISIFVGYLIPKPFSLKDSSGTI